MDTVAGDNATVLVVPADDSRAMKTRFVFCASTGRTATMFLAKCLDQLPGVVGLHEGHQIADRPRPRLPLINVHNRRAWYDPEYAARIVAEMRDEATLRVAAGEAGLLVDVAYYNAPLLPAIIEQHPDALLFVVFRRCEGFVRSATIARGEDRQPAGWPYLSKSLTDREKFISLGRLKPEPDHRDHASWSEWSAIQRNIWLWTTVNEHLLRFSVTNASCHRLYFEELTEGPEAFWSDFLQKLRIPSRAALHECVTRSRFRVNQRHSHQIGGAASWTPAERALYTERALPLESAIYG